MPAYGYEQTLQIHLFAPWTTLASGHRNQLFGTILAGDTRLPMFLELPVKVVDPEGAQDLS